MDGQRSQSIISGENIKNNFEYIKTLVPKETRVIAVVKADAYGHGAAEVCHTLEKAGCGFFAVASFDEGIKLREYGVKSDILVLGVTPPRFAAEICSNDLIQAVNSVEYAKALSASAPRLRVHIKVDTGMSRLGLYCHNEGDISAAAHNISKIASLANLNIEGIFTHYACSDNLPPPGGEDFTKKQFLIFSRLCGECAKAGVEPGIRHCCNSGGIINYPETCLDAVRAGILLYGYMPNGQKNKSLSPAMRFVSHIAQISRLKKGDKVSYGGGFTAERDLDAAVVSIGYADGFSRRLSGNASLAINGVRARVIGRICMDLCVADVTGISCKVGDEAEVFGNIITADELARALGTINYEVLCSVSGRVVKKYI